MGRAARAGDRRRARRARLRHRRAEGDAGARRQGLGDRPRSRSPGADRDRAGRADERGVRRARRSDAGGGRAANPRLAARPRPAREARVVPPHGRALRPLQDEDRASDLASVVVLDGRAEAAGAGGAPLRPRPLPPRVATSLCDLVARGGPGLEHLAADLVGSPAAALAVPGRPLDVRRGGAGRVLRVRLRRADPERGRPRHVVLVGALAVRHARLAGRHRRPPGLLPRRSATRRRATSSASGRTG